MFPISVILAVLIIGLTLFALALLIVLTIILGMLPYAFKIIVNSKDGGLIFFILLIPFAIIAGIIDAIS